MDDTLDPTANLDPTSRGDLQILGRAMRALHAQGETVEHLLSFLANAGAKAAVEGNTRLVIRCLAEIRAWLKLELDRQDRNERGNVVDVEVYGTFDLSAETAKLLARIDRAIEEADRASGDQATNGDARNGSLGL